MSSKKPCINNPSFTYTGKEQSPLRFGLTAEGYDVNSIMEGHDKSLWIVEIKNNRKVWVKKDENYKITPEEPVIKEFDTNSETVENRVVESNANTPIKRTTDYNIFLRYMLNVLNKEDNVDNNKNNFNTVISEWNRLKKSVDDNDKKYLASILESARKYNEENPVKKSTKKNIQEVKSLNT